MSKEKISGIYKITNLVNGKMYIGQSIDIYKRWREHKAISLNKESQAYNYPIYCAFRKYGFENFKFEVIEECSTDKLDEKEIYYIEKYNTFTLWKNSNGYNQTIGGSGTKGIISRGAKTICEGNTFNTIKECAEYYNVDFTNMHNWLYKTGYMPKEWYDKGLHLDGVPLETYKIQTGILRGENHPNSIKVICENKEFNSIKECADYYGESKENISGWVKHEHDMPKRFYDMGLHIKNESMDKYYYYDDNFRTRKIICDGIVYTNRKEFCEKFNLKPNTVKTWLNHSRPMPKEWYDKGLRYDNESITNYSYTIRKSKKKVICNNIIYEKIKDFCEEYNISQSTVNCWLKGKRTMPQKFIDLGLKYYTDEIN